MRLKPITKKGLENAREWRNECLESLRTSDFLTREQQEEFFKNLPNTNHRYYLIENVGVGGITNIQWENRIGEISLILNPDMRGRGYGMIAVDLLLDKAFNQLNLQTVCGECYLCNPNEGFWQKVIEKYMCFSTLLPNRKFWDGKFWDSIYFSIDRGNL